MDTCARCDAPLHASIMSKFNRDIICIPCKEEEAKAPGYAAASEAELRAVQRGEYNFHGVGLSPADTAFLKNLRERRSETCQPKMTK